MKKLIYTTVAAGLATAGLLTAQGAFASQSSSLKGFEGAKAGCYSAVIAPGMVGHVEINVANNFAQAPGSSITLAIKQPGVGYTNVFRNNHAGEFRGQNIRIVNADPVWQPFYINFHTNTLYFGGFYHTGMTYASTQCDNIR